MKRVSQIAIVGAGFMGGSLAKALRKKFPSMRLLAYTRSKRSLTLLRKTGIFSLVTRDLPTAVSAADIVVLASPVQAIITYFAAIKPFLKKGAIVTDLGSSKQDICAAANKILPGGISFIGSHPLAGSQNCGVAFSRADLYQGAVCVITADKNITAAKIVAKLWRSVGAKVIFMSPANHDVMLSAISHLPHVISFSLTDYILREYASFAPASLKDLTRISQSPSGVWADILLSNRKNIVGDIQGFIKKLRVYEKLIKNNDRNSILTAINQANQKQKVINGYRY